MAGAMQPTEREAYMASLLANVPAFDVKSDANAQVSFQEYGSCFTLLSLEDIIVCGCDQPECKDGVYQLMRCASSPSRGPLRCAWFDTQSRYASVEMTATEAQRACTQHDMNNDQSESATVRARSATASTIAELNERCVTPLVSPAAAVSPSLQFDSDSSTEIAVEMLHWLNDPSLTSSTPAFPRSPQTQSVYDDAESPLYLSYIVGDRVMLRHSEQEPRAGPHYPQDDGPYIVAEVLGSTAYRVVREHDSTSRVVHYSKILHRLDASVMEDSALTHDTSCVGKMTTKDGAACRTSDSAVASWLNDAAPHFPQPGLKPAPPLETQRPVPNDKPVTSTGQKRARIATASRDDKPAPEPRKRRKLTKPCVLCDRD